MDRTRTENSPYFNRTVWAVGTFVASNAIVLQLERAFRISLTAPFEYLLGKYRAIVDYLMGPVEFYFLQFLAVINAYIPLHLQMTPNWRYIFVPMVLYFNTDFKINFERKRFASLIVGVVFGFLIALFSGVRLGIEGVVGGLVSEMILPMFGFVLFLFLQSITTAYFNPHGDQGFLETFKYYLKNTTMPGVIYACFSMAIGLLITMAVPGVDESATVTIVMLTYVLMMSAYWVAQAGDVARDDHRNGRLAPGVSVEDRYKALGSYKFGMLVFGIMLFVAALLGVNWVLAQILAML